jgi:uncharacterized protein (DUF305 family)
MRRIFKFALPRRRAFIVIALLVTIFGATSAVWMLFATDPTLSTLAADSGNTMDASHDHASTIPSRSGMPDASQSNFDSEMAQVNAQMHDSMEVVPSGDPDHDFVQMMIPHHQGAIDMSLVLLKYGRDEKLKRLAQSIIVEQGQEIAYMRSLLAAPSGETAHTQP